MLNSTCRLLSTGYKFTVDQQGLDIKPCCLYKQGHQVKNKVDIIRWRDKVNSVDSYSSPNCIGCNFLDKTKVRKSRRDIGFDLVPETLEVGDPSILEIQIDTTCNGGCIMCGPWFSSFWAQELGVQVPSKSKQDYFSTITDLVDIGRAKNIIILGGEPLLSDVDERVIDLLKSPDQVTIQFTTNGSIYPTDKRIKRWEKVGRIQINFSIDGIGDRFNYIRYPLQWSKVEQNISRMLDEFPDNVTFKINHTANILNLLYFDEFEQWFNENFKVDRRGRTWHFSFTPADGLFSPKTVTPAIKDLVLQKYSPDQVPAKVIETTDRDCTELLSFLNELDQRRDQDWRKTFPEIFNCL